MTGKNADGKPKKKREGPSPSSPVSPWTTEDYESVLPLDDSKLEKCWEMQVLNFLVNGFIGKLNEIVACKRLQSADSVSDHTMDHIYIDTYLYFI